MIDLILASASPRRRELLTQIGVRFDSQPVGLPEVALEGETPEQFVRRLALDKARAGFERSGGELPTLGSDTAVVLSEHILGKPADEADALRMLMLLSGHRHQVLTGIALVDHRRSESRVVTTDVEFRTLSEAEIRRYWASGEPRDKAGAYGIQGLGAVFVSRIEGSYSAVVGLPLAETAELLVQFDVPIWQNLNS